MEIAYHISTSVKDSGERSALKPRVLVIWVHIRGNNGPVEGLTAGQVGIKVDVCCQGKVLVVIFGTLAEQHQVDVYLDQITNSLAEKAYVVAEYYERVKQPGPAAIYYESIVRRWPDTTWSARAQNRLDVMGYLSGEPAESAAFESPPEDTKPADSRSGETQ